MGTDLEVGWYILHVSGSDGALASEKCYFSFGAAKSAREEDPEVRDHSNAIAYWNGKKWRGLRGV